MPADPVSAVPAGPVLRFAPSPTGRLHVGNARVALANALAARALRGTLRLRLDDTDLERCRPEFAAAAIADLAWLGIDFAGPVERQSMRGALHAAAAERLKAAGRLYPCYETPEELDLKRKVALTAGRPPVYDRAALALTAAERTALEAAGRPPHWRFKLAPGAIGWDDLVRGPVAFDAANLSDPVLIRADGTPLYHLPSVVDDIEMGVGLVVRGEDHVDNTALHIQIFAALGAAVPRFAHLPLLLDASGAKLSKRLEALGLGALREAGIEAMAIVSYLARLGTADPIVPLPDIATAAEGFAFEKLGRGAARFDPAELATLNAKLVHQLPYAAVAERLAAQGFGALGAAAEPAWLALRSVLGAVGEAADWLPVLAGEIAVAPDPEAAAWLPEALRCLPPEPWDSGTWGAWTQAVTAATGVRGKPLFMALRRCLTGREHGPELKALLPLIGHSRSAERLAAALHPPAEAPTA